MKKYIRGDIDLFYLRLKRGWISEEKKKILYNLVINLEKRTEIQKERFILYYGLKPKQKEKYNYTSLGKKNGCTNNAIRYSVNRIKNTLANLHDERKKIFLEIVKDNDYFTKINHIMDL